MYLEDFDAVNTQLLLYNVDKFLISVTEVFTFCI